MVCAVAQQLGEHRLRVATEVPFMSQSIDMVFEDHGGRLVAVEFKRHDWNGAVRQSKTHLLGADEVYICIPRREPTESMAQTLNEHGIGLMLYEPLDGSMHVEIPARKATGKLAFPRKWLRYAFEFRMSMEDADGPGCAAEAFPSVRNT